MSDRIYARDDIIQNRYVVQEVLGAGSFSVVYKVLDTFFSEVVALKVFKEGTDVLEQLRQEFQILKGLAHPHIARVYDGGGLPDYTYFLKLEFVEGITLASLIHQGRISLGKARQITEDLLSAVAYMHSCHVMHRDIKPSNVIINGRGAVIVDFNISKQVESHASSRAGTPGYMPPEVAWEGWNWTGDLYAVGVVLYEMVTGHRPYEDVAPLTPGTLRDPRGFNPSLSPGLAQMILKSVALGRADRFQKAGEMLAAVQAVSWEPVWQPYSMSPEELSRIRALADETVRPNSNPYLSHLLTLYSQSRHTNAGTRGLDSFARATYVPTRLDTVLKPAILSGGYALVIITGNAGDGKTAFVQMLEENFRHDPTFRALDTGNGAQFTYDGRHFLTNYDGSQDEGLVDNDQVLSRFFRPFAGNEPFPVRDRVHVIAINEGRLVDFLQSHRDEYRYLYRQVRGFFDQGCLPESGLLFVNLNLRAVVAGENVGEAIFDQMVDRLAAPALWEKCRDCDIADRCYAKFNADSLNDLSYGPQIRQRLKALFQIAHIRQRLHITIRDLRSALAYVLCGVDDCEGIHALLLDPERRSEYLARFYYNAVFDFERPERRSQDRLVSFLSQVDPGRVSKPKLDARLAVTPPDQLSLLPPFDTRSECDRQLLCSEYEALQGLNQAVGAEPVAAGMDPYVAVVRSARLYHASLRRKAYFERVDEDWAEMLPYTRFPDFRALMQASDSARLEEVRDRLVHAISLSEGVYGSHLGQEYLCLRSQQEPKATIKSIRRFHRDRFRCRVQEIGELGRFIEFLPSVLLFEYPLEQGKGIQMDVSLDLYEMLHHILKGYTPSLNELRGSYINLLIFKRQLASTPYDEVLLTEDEQTFYRVSRTSSKKLVMMRHHEGV